ncbi:hypothetical protein WA026_017836 [Henosepilachna vigintioctopunctata]|uniref:CHK kinase-like domain-containing protein n=1 Tax=Henosepilachna vigintioctopunctata TaxID=420089 RepID=A0AAW1TPX1_9CUCU
MKNELQQNLESFVTEVLSNLNFDKLTIEFPGYDPTGGYAADMIFAKVTGEKNCKKEILDIIIKKSKDSAVNQETLNLRNAYINEVNMYSKFIPYLQNFAKKRNCQHFEHIPHCYGTMVRDDQFIVFLENLKLRGFKLHEIGIPHDINHNKIILRAYAKFHALCLALRDQEPEIFREFEESMVPLFSSDNKMFDMLLSSVQKEIEYAIKIYEEKNKPTVVKKLKTLIEKYGETLKDCFDYKDEDFLVIRHGDCWNNNYLFYYNKDESVPENVMLIDWQFGCLGSPLADICTYLFYCCSKKELEHLDELLEIYYETLCIKLEELGSNPEKCFPKKNLRKSFHRYALLGIGGMTMSVKISCLKNLNKTFDIGQAAEDGNFNGVLAGEIDEKKYFDRINGVFEHCIARNLI